MILLLRRKNQNRSTIKYNVRERYSDSNITEVNRSFARMCLLIEILDMFMIVIIQTAIVFDAVGK